MQVLFQATHIIEKVTVTPELKQYYENLISLLASNIVESETIEHIESIIIPEDFVSAVLEFQTAQRDEHPSVTDNEFGRAYGKIIKNANTGKYTVFIDVSLAAFIMEDVLFDSCFKNVDEPNYDDVIKQRQLALNILSHELSHVELATKVIHPRPEKSLKSIYIYHAFNLFDEYYACRKASRLYSTSLADNDEQFILDLEDKIDIERWKYKNHKLSLNMFVGLFHQYSEMSLIRLVSVLGGYASEGKEELPFPNSIVGRQAMLFKQCFGSLFEAINAGKGYSETLLPINAIHQYYKDLGVTISDTAEGLYYSIPD